MVSALRLFLVGRDGTIGAAADARKAALGCDSVRFLDPALSGATVTVPRGAFADDHDTSKYGRIIRVQRHYLYGKSAEL